jgi:hypothetical protein
MDDDNYTSDHNEIESDALFHILHDNLSDIDELSNAFVEWLRGHPDKLDSNI